MTGQRLFVTGFSWSATAVPIVVLLFALLLAGCASGPSPDRVATRDAVPRDEPYSTRGNPDNYTVLGKRYTVLASNAGFRERGVASWYGNKFHGRPTSSGEPYDMYKMTAAHKSLRLPTYVRVTNLDNGKSVVVRVNDRGPFVEGRIIDLSYAAAHKIEMTGKGTVPVEIEVIGSEGTRTAARSAAPARNPGKSRNLGPRPMPNARWGENVFVQIGAFRNADNAEAIGARLRRAGLSAVSQSAGGWTRVRVGPLASADEFDSVRERLYELGFQETTMVVKK
ncbi:septal ring lytic transglycosylase RlpA family protein [Guyparkeria halophila]|uniref:Endolytic peptidoglycan transglycosylase RlpA n=1 Tax=Guyparkeria halophila TaxID=47960 RepID=A0ABZ0YYL3_9GAMM|nr:septal ring lytic transglycosylase RlpA family protein [Guyparkeria halophila]WQH16803.1 septal ring lytic transglycosylase RlpA family protein [Guyparkeria halophila]